MECSNHFISEDFEQYLVVGNSLLGFQRPICAYPTVYLPEPSDIKPTDLDARESTKVVRPNIW